MRCRFVARATLALIAALTVACVPQGDPIQDAAPEPEATVSFPEWSAPEVAIIQSLSIANLPALPRSESNRYADNEQAARFGQKLFFEKRLSSNGQVSCATCHQPERDFTDGLRVGVGVAPVGRHTMSLIGVSYSPWLFWDGRADSLWSQALGPLEDASEHGGTRTQYAQLVAKYYRAEYEAVFGSTTELERISELSASGGPLGNFEELQAWEQMSEADRDAANRVFANIGKAIDAFQRRLLPQSSRFDDFVDTLANGDRRNADKLLSATEQHGLKLFIGAADCTHCHNGPLLSNNDFHNTSIATADEGTLAEGRARGVHRLRNAEFNCLGDYSDADENGCMELQFLKAQGSELMSAFRTPGLRNVARTAPYMHNGRFSTLEEVVDHYNTAPPSVLGQSELIPLALNDQEKTQLVAFLKTLDEHPPVTPDPWRRGQTTD